MKAKFKFNFFSQMAAVQATIPFRSRKKTSLRNHCKSDENKDILNTQDPVKEKVLKRRLKSNLKEGEEHGEFFFVKLKVCYSSY